MTLFLWNYKSYKKGGNFSMAIIIAHPTITGIPLEGTVVNNYVVIG